MTTRTLKTSFLAIALLATGGGLRAADAGAKPAAEKPAAEKEKPAQEKSASKAEAPKTDAQKAFRIKADAMVAARQALMDQLKNATEEQRKEILKKLEAQQKEIQAAQGELMKQMRDDMRKAKK